jgi:flagellar hook protein FlgE
MITVQRAYSASTRIISTADEMLAELSNLRR